MIKIDDQFACRWYFRAALATALLAHACMVAWLAAHNSPSPDEIAHLPAGMLIWQHGRYDLYPVNPPLVKAVAAIPVVLSSPRVDWTEVGRGRRPEFAVGIDFVELNGPTSFRYFTLARWACIPFSLAGAYLCYRWASELYGGRSGLAAAILWCFCPNVLANAGMITPDVATSTAGLLAVYCFSRWIDSPTWRRTAAAGLALGIAELTKITWLILYGLFPLLWLALRARRDRAEKRWIGSILQMAAMFALSVYVIDLAYVFDSTFIPLKEYKFETSFLKSATIDGVIPESGNRFAGSILGELPVVLPKWFIGGIDMQKSETDEGKQSYLRGEVSNRGWWYYYIYGISVKTPLGTLGLISVAFLLVADRRYTAGWKAEALLLIPAASVLLLMSAHTGLNRHMRYVLPIFPFLFVWASKLFRAFALGNYRLGTLAVVLALQAIFSSLSIFPYSMSYFNELAGGPDRGHDHLLGSNVDWGQDMYRLRRWYDEHPSARPFHCECATLLKPADFGIAADPMAAVISPGWYAITVNFLHGTGERYRIFRSMRPVAKVGYSTCIFHVTERDISSLAPHARGRPGYETHHPNPVPE